MPLFGRPIEERLPPPDAADSPLCHVFLLLAHGGPRMAAPPVRSALFERRRAAARRAATDGNLPDQVEGARHAPAPMVVAGDGDAAAVQAAAPPPGEPATVPASDTPPMPAVVPIRPAAAASHGTIASTFADIGPAAPRPGPAGAEPPRPLRLPSRNDLPDFYGTRASAPLQPSRFGRIGPVLVSVPASVLEDADAGASRIAASAATKIAVPPRQYLILPQTPAGVLMALPRRSGRGYAVRPAPAAMPPKPALARSLPAPAPAPAPTLAPLAVPDPEPTLGMPPSTALPPPAVPAAPLPVALSTLILRTQLPPAPAKSRAPTVRVSIPRVSLPSGTVPVAAAPIPPAVSPPVAALDPAPQAIQTPEPAVPAAPAVVAPLPALPSAVPPTVPLPSAMQPTGDARPVTLVKPLRRNPEPAQPIAARPPRLPTVLPPLRLPDPAARVLADRAVPARKRRLRWPGIRRALVLLATIVVGVPALLVTYLIVRSAMNPPRNAVVNAAFVPVLAPADGIVVDAHAVEGQAVDPDTVLFGIRRPLTSLSSLSVRVVPGAAPASTPSADAARAPVQDVKAGLTGLLWSVVAIPGTQVTSGATLAQVADCDRLFLSVPDGAGALKPGQAVSVQFDSATPFRAAVRADNPGASPAAARPDGTAAGDVPRPPGAVMLDATPDSIRTASGDRCPVGRVAAVRLAD